MDTETLAAYQTQLGEIRASGLWKDERIIAGPQGPWIMLDTGQRVLNLCANNYLGLSDHPAVVEAAKASYERLGYGVSSVRFICGTQTVHKELEAALAGFLGTQDAVLYSSCFDANGGLFETLLTERDAVISDELNHASIIDGIRLCKAARYRYANNDMGSLEEKLREARANGARAALVATDGVFSMDGTVADLKGVCNLAERYGAMVMVDDSHAAGFMGATGRGTPEHCGVAGRVDILTGTLGKALGGASGGYTAARREVADLLRQRSRPYLFSNSLAPAIAAASLAAIRMLELSTELRDRLEANARYFRDGMKKLGFDIPEGIHPIAPIMLYDAGAAQEMARRMLGKGVYVTGFFYPVVPRGKARVRTQVSAAHTRGDLDFAIGAFAQCRAEMGLSP